MRTMFSTIVSLMVLIFSAGPAAGFGAQDPTTAETTRLITFIARFQKLFEAEDITGLIRDCYHPEIQFWLWDRNGRKVTKYIGIPGMLDYVGRMFAMLTGPAEPLLSSLRVFPNRVNVVFTREIDGLNQDNVVLTIQDNDDGNLRIIHADINYDGVPLDEFEPIPWDPPADLAYLFE